jgi:anti-sigma factor RsiW
VADPSAGHAGHDPLLIVAFLDDDLSAAERAAVETILATCPDCAALQADLVVLATATRALPIPARPRDFRLTAADAARLTAAASGEPGDPTARLAGVMTARPTTPDHADHDRMLVASLADHSLTTGERAAAEALVASCDDCAALHADFLALRDATRAMPTPARSRDYRLTAADAARLRRSGWRRFVAVFGSSRDAFSRPLAVGLTTLGLAGLLFASVPSMLPQSGSTSQVPSAAGAAAGNGAARPEAGTDSSAGPVPAASAAAVQAPAAGIPSAAAPAATAPTPDAFGPLASAGSSGGPIAGDFGIKGVAPSVGQVPTRASDSAGSEDLSGTSGSIASEAGLPLLVIVSGALLLVGLGLFAIRWSARRLGDG